MISLPSFLTFALLATHVEPQTIPLWPNGAPGAMGTEDKDKPSLTLYLAAKEKANGTAVVVCPGGGYGGLAISQVLWIVSIGNIGIALSSLHMNATPFYVMLILFAMGGVWNWTQAFAAAIVGFGVLIAQGVIPLWGFSRLAIKKTST